jgi:hypothetical protein
MNFFRRSGLQRRRKSLALNGLPFIVGNEGPLKNPSFFCCIFFGALCVLQAPLDAKKGQAQTLGKAHEASQP